jgi:hypothetical protein
VGTRYKKPFMVKKGGINLLCMVENKILPKQIFKFYEESSCCQHIYSNVS